MTIQIRNTFPSDRLVPGVSHETDLYSGSRSLVPSTRRVLLLNAKKTAGTATADVPVQIFSSQDADALFGSGSPLAVMYRAAAAVAIAQGSSPEFFGAPLTPPGGGTAASNGTITLTGTATAAGEAKFSIAGVKFSAPIASGANVTTAAAAMVTAVSSKLAQIPGTVASALGVVTYTHSVTGVDGNDVQLRVESLPAGLSAVAVQPSNGAGVLTYTTALTNALTRDFDMIAFASHTSTEITAALTHLGEAWGASIKRWRHCVFGERGSVATCTTLAGNANDYRVIVGAYPDSPALPCVIAAALATLLMTRDAPNYNHNFTKLAAIPSVLEADVLIDSEIQTLLAGGCTPFTLDNDQTGVTMLQRPVTTKKTEGGNPFLNLLPVGNSMTVIWAMRQCDARVAQILKNRNVDVDLIRDVKGGILDILKAGEEKGYLHNVDAHAGEIKAVADPDSPNRIFTEIPECPVPTADQVHNVHRMFVEPPAA